MELYLVRHGQTQANLDGVYCGSSDLALTALGEQQADAVAAQLAGVSFDVVYTSGLQRTHQTAQRILGADAEFVQLIGLDEWHLASGNFVTTKNYSNRMLSTTLLGVPIGSEPFRRAGRDFVISLQGYDWLWPIFSKIMRGSAC